MFNNCINNTTAIWRDSLAGAGLILAFAVIGWRIGWNRGFWLVEVAWFWLEHLLRPLILNKSLLRRSCIIAVNNTFICASIVMLGSLRRIAWVGLVVFGLCLGISFRMMLTQPPQESDISKKPAQDMERIEVTGISLNLFEIPALIICAGLSLAQGAFTSTMDLTTAMTTFMVMVAPLLLISATGQAMWLDKR